MAATKRQTKSKPKAKTLQRDVIHQNADGSFGQLSAGEPIPADLSAEQRERLERIGAI